MSRKQAKIEGRKIYFTGKPCKQGHICERITASGTCVECARQTRKRTYNSENQKHYMREYYRKNKQDLLEYTHKYYQNNSSHLQRWSRQYYMDHRQHYVNYNRQYYQDHKLYFKDKNQQYYLDHIEYFRQYWTDNAAQYNTNSAKRRSLAKQSIPLWADLNRIQQIYEESKRLTQKTGIVHNVDHIIPLQHTLVCGLHCEENLQILTEKENKEKSNHFSNNGL